MKSKVFASLLMCAILLAPRLASAQVVELKYTGIVTASTCCNVAVGDTVYVTYTIDFANALPFPGTVYPEPIGSYGVGLYWTALSNGGSAYSLPTPAGLVFAATVVDNNGVTIYQTPAPSPYLTWSQVLGSTGKGGSGWDAHEINQPGPTSVTSSSVTLQSSGLTYSPAGLPIIDATTSSAIGTFAFGVIQVDANGVPIGGTSGGLTFSLTPCVVNPTDVNVVAGPGLGGKFSRDGKPITMIATFKPTDSAGMPVGLTQIARECGYINFDFQQQVTSLPAPSPFFPNVPAYVPDNISPDGSLKAPPAFLDPVPGDYRYENADSYPFYYTLNELINGNEGCTNNAFAIETRDTLMMTDCPADKDLLLLPPSVPRLMSFKTSLVGVLASSPLFPSSQAGKPSRPLKTWTWTSNFNGTKGGVQLASRFAPDPSSGTGGVVITSIDDIPQTPPAATCRATVRARDDKPAVISVSGTVAPGTSPIAANGTTYTVKSRKGSQLQSGSFEVGAEGVYSFQLLPIRSDDDQTLIILVAAADGIGNVGTCSADARVRDE